MEKEKVRKTATLADEIAEILNSAPASFDPEDDVGDATNARIAEESTEDGGNEEEEEKIPSKFRRDNANLLADLDEKYAGIKTSRKTMRDSDPEDIPSDGSKFDGESSIDDERDAPEQSDESHGDENDGGSDESGEENEDSDNWESLDGEDSEGTDANFKHISDVNVSSQVKKGICVRNQMVMWENLLEVRIQLQKCLLTANKMPPPSTFKEMGKESGQEFANKVTETTSVLSDTLEKLLLLQRLLARQFPETKRLGLNSGKGGDGDDEEIPSDSGESGSEEEITESGAPQKKQRKLEHYEKDISDRHETYKKYRNSVIQKWNEKTRVVLKGGATSHSVLDQIEYNLSNRDKLVKRTQLRRSPYSILGKEEEKNGAKDEEHNPDIFDDDDFYHQLLRELIETKSADVTDPVQLGRQWIQLQSLRSKMKRKVDTRATKGRKIRYVVHNKLVNFMAPIDENSWTDESKNELYSSLFGKNQQIINV